VYDLIVQDAVNDLSVPFHLMTREYNDEVKGLLKPDGVYALSVIDEIPRGDLLRSAVRTLRETFPVVAVLHYGEKVPSDRSPYLVVGSGAPLDYAEMARLLAHHHGHPMGSRPLGEAQLEAYLHAGRAVLLSDDYAPVDNLLAELFLRRERVSLTLTAPGGN
jgi:hypothetical protein